MKDSNVDSPTTNHTQTDDRPRGTERLELICRGLDEGKSQRKIADELGYDEGTIRRDLDKLALPNDQLIAIQNGDTAEQYLDKARFEKTGIDQKVLKIRRKRLRAEKATGVPSDEAEKVVSAWLIEKVPITRIQQLILHDVEGHSQDIPDQQRAPRSDTAALFSRFERGMVDGRLTESINSQVNVLVSVLVHIAPEKAIRDAAIRKAQQEARRRAPHPPDSPRRAIEKARQRKRRQLRDRNYEA
jgi:hypothetical protein